MREEISERFLEFAVKMIDLGRKMNHSFEGRHVYGQLSRAGTSSGANYEESHSAQSPRNFIHKREVSLKELRETLFWLRLIERSSIVSPTDELLISLLEENQQLIRIIAEAISTNKKKAGKTSKL